MSILVINSSIRGDASATRQLVAAYVNAVRGKQPAIEIIEHDLAQSPLHHLKPEILPAMFGLPEADLTTIALSDKLTDELIAADTVVIGVPMYNFGVPSGLKAWIDHVVRRGRTFGYGPNGPEALLPPGKKLILFIASGGVYTEGPAKPLDFTENYLRSVFGFLGIKDVTVVRAEGQSMPDIGAANLKAGAQAASALA